MPTGSWSNCGFVCSITAALKTHADCKSKGASPATIRWQSSDNNHTPDTHSCCVRSCISTNSHSGIICTSWMSGSCYITEVCGFRHAVILYVLLVSHAGLSHTNSMTVRVKYFCFSANYAWGQTHCFQCFIFTGSHSRKLWWNTFSSRLETYS